MKLYWLAAFYVPTEDELEMSAPTVSCGTMGALQLLI